jgi:hypothetical protein
MRGIPQPIEAGPVPEPMLGATVEAPTA